MNSTWAQVTENDSENHPSEPLKNCHFCSKLNLTPKLSTGLSDLAWNEDSKIGSELNTSLHALRLAVLHHLETPRGLTKGCGLPSLKSVNSRSP